MIWSLARNEEHVQTRLVSWEFRCNRLRSLDNPEMEDLAFYHKVVLETYAFMYLIDGILRISWHDTVYKCAVHSAGLFEPCPEAFSEIPEVDVLIYALLEFLAIEEDKFARKDDESFPHIAIEVLVSVIQELGELAWI